MQREVFFPENEAHWLELRAQDLTSTAIPALFGLSPYFTQYELFFRHRDKLTVTMEPNDRIRWGNRLEAAIANGIATDEGWKIRPKKEYIRISELRIGSSFDFEIEEKDAVLEIKNVDALAFKEGWLVDGETIESPPHIEIQVQVQMLVAGKLRGYIGALVGGNRVVLLERKADPAIHNAILKKSLEFWWRVDNDKPPAPNFARDAEFICSLYKDATAGKVIEVTDSGVCHLLERYRAVGERIKELEIEKEGLKAQVLMACGDAERAVGPDFSIGMRNISVKEKTVQVQAYNYRQFLPRFKKVQE